MAAPNPKVSTTAASASAAAGIPAVTIGSTVPKATPHVEKPQQFNGEDFKRWQQKMVFYLTTLNLAHILKEDCPVTPEGEESVETQAAKKAWQHSDFLCRNYILSGLVDSLYNVYCTAYPTSKQLWEALDKKYKLEDAGTKKFLVEKFLNYKMVDTKIVVSQLEELQVLLSDLLGEGLVINEPFQVAVVIEKLPPSWKDFKNYLKHKWKELSMENLAVRLRIEEDNRKGDKVSLRMEAKANVVEASKPQTKK
ncbi:uncharacterized protein LOC127788770 [Diospyros lotus]|uniref:uncharacterized protein LOC127788770 n=1 Tax=Diospyros lotus TaxID=55363 RepID=UPI0022536A99|nr:uncharacterized protein LOC127788770 [Diospyros lotus]